MEFKTRFRLANLEVMGAELASRILIMHVNESLSEDAGKLSELTKDLFKINLPKFEFTGFIYDTRVKGKKQEGIQLGIALQYQGESRHKIKIKCEIVNKKSYGEHFKISLTRNHSSIFANSCILRSSYHASPFIRTNEFADIIVNERYKEVEGGTHRVLISFLKAFFLHMVLGEERENLIENQYWLNEIQTSKLLKQFEKEINIDYGSNRN